MFRLTIRAIRSGLLTVVLHFLFFLHLFNFFFPWDRIRSESTFRNYGLIVQARIRLNGYEGGMVRVFTPSPHFLSWRLELRTVDVMTSEALRLSEVDISADLLL